MVLTPMYFMYSNIGKYSRPLPTHPELYYDFARVALAWQLAFFVIATVATLAVSQPNCTAYPPNPKSIRLGSWLTPESDKWVSVPRACDLQ